MADDAPLSVLRDRLTALTERIGIIDREGSRGVAVLVERVTGLVRQVEELRTALERTQAQFREDLERLEAQVKALEAAREQHVGLTSGLKTAFGVYAAVGAALAGVILQVALR